MEKEDELKQLKAELATLDRKILLSLKSVDAQEANAEGVTEIRPEQQGAPVAQSAPSMPDSPAVPAASPEPYIHRMPDYIGTCGGAQTAGAVSHAQDHQHQGADERGKEKVVIGGIPQPEDGTEKPQEKTEMEDEAVSGVH